MLFVWHIAPRFEYGSSMRARPIPLLVGVLMGAGVVYLAAVFSMMRLPTYRRLLLLVGVVAMAYRCERRGLVPKSYKWMALGPWVIYSGLFGYFGLRFKLPDDAAAWVMDFPYPIDWGLWVGISALPIAPLFLHPLLVGRSRVN